MEYSGYRHTKKIKPAFLQHDASRTPPAQPRQLALGREENGLGQSISGWTLPIYFAAAPFKCDEVKIAAVDIY